MGTHIFFKLRGIHLFNLLIYLTDWKCQDFKKSLRKIQFSLIFLKVLWGIQTQCSILPLFCRLLPVSSTPSAGGKVGTASRHHKPRHTLNQAPLLWSIVCDFVKPQVSFLKKIHMIFINKNEPENNSSLGDSKSSHFISSLIFNAKYTYKNAVWSHKPISCIPTRG